MQLAKVLSVTVMISKKKAHVVLKSNSQCRLGAKRTMLHSAVQYAATLFSTMPQR